MVVLAREANRLVPRDPFSARDILSTDQLAVVAEGGDPGRTDRRLAILEAFFPLPHEARTDQSGDGSSRLGQCSGMTPGGGLKYESGSAALADDEADFRSVAQVFSRLWPLGDHDAASVGR